MNYESESDEELMFVFEREWSDVECRARPANPMAQLLELQHQFHGKRKALEDDDQLVYHPQPKRMRPSVVRPPLKRTKNIAIPATKTSLELFCRHSIDSSCSPLNVQFHAMFVGSQESSGGTWRSPSQWNQFTY
ncbi:hypothetical protein THRCLA_21892 [Thraustotheca clavata]|uniref:Uncharacterized protein n=1 Tax=Thraustotheca clavata TaxID=74557 RepID=A0A1V9ZK58_9STRA|nr:hypothetical protein THRCLA_21892 [Thraustotheca clavata]